MLWNTQDVGIWYGFYLGNSTTETQTWAGSQRTELFCILGQSYLALDKTSSTEICMALVVDTESPPSLPVLTIRAIKEAKCQVMMEWCCEAGAKTDILLKNPCTLNIKKAYASLPRWGIHRDHCCWICTDLHKLKVWHHLSTPSQSLKSMGDDKPSLDGNGDFITPGGCWKILCSASQIRVMGLRLAPACHGESLMSK